MRAEGRKDKMVDRYDEVGSYFGELKELFFGKSYDPQNFYLD
jgi:hypothetical protein